MIALHELAREVMPAGLAEPPAAPLRRRVCERCGASLFEQDHDRRCPERARIYRLNVTNDPVMRRHEDLLQVCTRRAFAAWLEGRAP